MTKTMVDVNYHKYLKTIVKNKEREDKETKQRNRRGSITLPQPTIEIGEFVAVSKLWLGFGK